MTDTSLLREQLTPANERYLLRSRPEIAALLRALARKRTTVAAYYGTGDTFLLTTILAFNADSQDLVLDAGHNARGRPGAGSMLTLVAFEDNVKVQFQVQHTADALWGGLPAIRVQAPRTLLRLQRRESYRLRLPLLRAAECRVPAAAGRASAKMRVVDISCVGLGLAIPSQQLRFAPGQRLRNCQLVLPGSETLVVTLEVRRIVDGFRTMTRGTPTCGCRFVDLPGPSATVIQRYINTVEREQRRLLD